MARNHHLSYLLELYVAIITLRGYITVTFLTFCDLMENLLIGINEWLFTKEEKENLLFRKIFQEKKTEPVSGSVFCT